LEREVDTLKSSLASQILLSSLRDSIGSSSSSTAALPAQASDLPELQVLISHSCRVRHALFEMRAIFEQLLGPSHAPSRSTSLFSRLPSILL
jgi:hypothetical protein